MPELISPELALVDPELAARARAALPEPDLTPRREAAGAGRRPRARRASRGRAPPSYPFWARLTAALWLLVLGILVGGAAIPHAQDKPRVVPRNEDATTICVRPQSSPASPARARRSASRSAPAGIATIRPPGAIAQLGERLDRTQEVGGSSPPSSIRLTSRIGGRAGRFAYSRKCSTAESRHRATWHRRPSSCSPHWGGLSWILELDGSEDAEHDGAPKCQTAQHDDHQDPVHSREHQDPVHSRERQDPVHPFATRSSAAPTAVCETSKGLPFLAVRPALWRASIRG